MFQFMYPLLVAGAATFAIPVVIHLIVRIRRRKVMFSSLRFLQQSVLRESSKLKLRELILLLLRCLACIFLALCFARPFRPDSALAGAGGKPKEDVVLVVDDSPSLMAQEGAGTRWGAILDRARKEVATHPSGDRVALVLVSEPTRAEIELTNNFGSVTASLTREKPSSKRGDLTQALNAALEMLVASPQPARRVVLYSDMQANQVDRGAWSTLAQKAASAGHGITVQLETPNGSKPPRLANLAVTDVRPKSDVWIEGRPVPFGVRVANYGDGEAPGTVVKLVIDGKTLATRTMGLGPRSSQEIELSAALPRAGEVFGYVEIDAHDALPDDDKRLFAVHLRDSLQVLVIEEQLGDKDAFLDEGYYMRMALDPRARSTDASRPASEGQTYLRVRSATAASATPDMYKNADLIVLAGITALKETELAMLEDAVRDGHNLILFTGRSDGRLSEAFYNGPLWKNGKGLLPARPGPLYVGNRLEGKYHQLGEFKADHDLFKPFSGENEPNLRLARYLRHFQANPADLKVGAEDTTRPGAAEEHPMGEVLATFGDNTPFAMERKFGKGSVLMFTFAPRPESTDLPKRKAFVPLLHQAVRHFAGVSSVSRRNLIVGDPFDFADAGVTPETAVTLEKPGVAKELLNLTGKDHPIAEIAGLYTAVFQKGNVQERALWAVNLDPRESELNSEDPVSLRELFAANPEKNSVSHSGGLVQWDDEQKAQAPDWRYFLVAAMACLLLEVWLRDFW